MILSLIDEATKAGARHFKACEVLELTLRTVQRWRQQGGGEDQRAGPKTRAPHALSEAEKRRILEISNSLEFRDKGPTQIVPLLADQGKYVASESTFYRVLREAGQLAHRQPSKAPQKRHKPRELTASAPNQVWCWDITYLNTSVRGQFYYLYLFFDLYSRRIMEWEVHEEESMDHSANLITKATEEHGVARNALTLHADNGGPMKGSTMLATLQKLGIAASFNRPRVSDDNPHAEALFRTLKYRPSYPRRPFASLEEARIWVADFVRWYNHEHLHSALRYVTPDDRYHRHDKDVLAKRRRVYARARQRNPRRWSGDTRNWERVGDVTLNPDRRPSREAAIH